MIKKHISNLTQVILRKSLVVQLLIGLEKIYFLLSILSKWLNSLLYVMEFQQVIINGTYDFGLRLLQRNIGSLAIKVVYIENGMETMNMLFIGRITVMI